MVQDDVGGEGDCLTLLTCCIGRFKFGMWCVGSLGFTLIFFAQIAAVVNTYK